MHLVLERYVPDSAFTTFVSLELGQVSTPEVLAEIARGMKLVDELFDAMIVRRQGECYSDADEASPRSLLLILNEEGYYGGMQ